MIAHESPDCIAIVRNIAPTSSLAGRPKEIFDTPSIVLPPSSSLTLLKVSRVVTAEPVSEEIVIQRPSITISFLGIPYLSASSYICLAILILSSELSGIPSSSRTNDTSTPPYFATRGITSLMTSSLPFTELIIGLPLYIRIALSRAVISVVSICRGSPVTPWRPLMTSSIIAGSSISGSPTFTSSIWAPWSSCFNPSLSIYDISFSLSACLNLFLPVGFILSPIITVLSPISTAWENDVTIHIFFSVCSLKGSTSTAFLRALIWSGVVPQQPPTTCTPRWAIFTIHSVNSSGPTVYIVFPSLTTGSPAFGFTMTGIEAAFTTLSTIGYTSWGPRLQLIPNASTLRPSSIATVDSTLPPVRSLPDKS